MDDVVCQGNETRLEDCQHATEDNCDATEAAGVVCDPRTPAQIAALEEKLTRECFVKDMTYKTDTISLDTVASVLDCQDYCVTTRGCSHFTYTASSKECKLLTAPEYCRAGLSTATISLRDDKFEVPCDDDWSSGGSWIVVQRRGQFGNPEDYFSSKVWADYRAGFGSVHGEFWLGLERLSVLTAHGHWEMRVDLTDWDGADYFALYDNFTVGPADTGYRLGLSNFSEASTLGDSLTGSESGDGKKFSTSDNDNDLWSGNCALKYAGAWWYDSCQKANLNAWNYGEQRTNSDARGIYWKFGGERGYGWVTWRGVRIKIRRRSECANQGVECAKEARPGALTGPRECAKGPDAYALCRATRSVCLRGDTERKTATDRNYRGNVFYEGKPVCDDHWSWNE